jgi:hypothetical protein
MQKLTLNAEPDVIERAKQLASERGTSVSKLFSQFIRSMEKTPRRRPTSSKTRQATGLIKLPKGKSDRQLIEEAVLERHSR